VPTHHDDFANHELERFEADDVSALIRTDFVRFKAELQRLAPYGAERFRELVPLRTVPLV